MCGRFTLSVTIGVPERFGLAQFPFQAFPRYNIAPSQKVPSIIEGGAGTGRTAVEMTWGISLPERQGFSRDSCPINVRDDSISRKPSFSVFFRKNRCLIPADGFFEWKGVPGRGRDPWYIRRQDREVFAFAGIFNPGMAAGPSSPVSCAILTTVANDAVSVIHDRMPVILDGKDEETWLGRETTEEDALACLKPCAPDILEMFPVSRTVNDTSQEGPDLVRRYTAEQTTLF